MRNIIITLLLSMALMPGVMAHTQEETIEITVGTGTSSCYTAPFSFFAKNSLTQQLITFEELRFNQGMVTSLMYETNQVLTTGNASVTIWLGETADADFSDWVDPASLTKVYEGAIEIAGGEKGSIKIDLDTPYEYKGENLVVYMHKTATAAISDLYCYGASVFGETKCRGVNSDTANYDPANPPANNVIINVPNITVFMEVGDMESYSVSFNVTDADGAAIDDAVITFDGVAMPAGQYVMENASTGEHSYDITKEGYERKAGSVVVFNGDIEETVSLRYFKDIPHISNYVVEDFDYINNNQKPDGWAGHFVAMEDGGMDDSKRFSASFWMFDSEKQIETNPIVMGADPVMNFYYRVLDYQSYPNNTVAGNGMGMEVSISKDMGVNWDLLHNIEPGEHNPSFDYQLIDIDVSHYANEICMLKVVVTRNFSMQEDFWFDVDNMTVGTQPGNDLLLLPAMQGNRIIGVNAENLYTLTVKNIGKAAQDDYKLRLMKEGGGEVVLSVGEAINPGEAKQYQLAWTPTDVGDAIVWGELISEADEVDYNNKSKSKLVNIQPEDVNLRLAYEEGTDVSNYLPYFFYYKQSLSQTMYYAEELGFANELVTGIAYQSKFEFPASEKISIWMGETDLESLYYDCVDPASLQKVFEGTVDFSTIDGANVIIHFDSPYMYSGQNLIVYSHKEGSSNDVLTNYFYGQNILGYVRSRAKYSDEPIDPATPPSSSDYLLSSIVNTVFLTQSIATFSVAFEVVDYLDSPIDDAVVTFDGTAMPAGQYTIGDVAAGSYDYTVSKGEFSQTGTVDVSDSDVIEKVVISTVAMETINNSTLSVYPNPTDGRFTVKEAAGIKSIKIYDISGRSVYSASNVNSSETVVDITGLSSGIYLLKVNNETMKIRKQ